MFGRTFVMRSIWPIIIASALTISSCRAASAQEGALPPVNLGDTSFLDGIGLPGWLTEEIGQGVHDNRAFNSSGHELPQTTDVNSGSSLTHIAWISHAKLLGAWYGAETIISAAYVDTGSKDPGYGFGAIALGPAILQWPEHLLGGVPIYQRAVLDLDAPTGKYSPDATVNIGSNAWDIQPYYAVTLFPTKRMETSWRVHYLWNGINDAPPFVENTRTTQAGQAVHFNGTLSFEMIKNLYIGANGYYLKQLTDARGNGANLPGSREQIGAIGPGMVLNSGKWFFYINGYREVGAESTTAGNKLVLRVQKVF